MWFQSDDDPVKRSSTERYSRVSLCHSVGSSFFNILWLSLKYHNNLPSYFQFSDNMILLTALYAVTAATAMFIMSVVRHLMHYSSV